MRASRAGTSEPLASAPGTGEAGAGAASLPETSPAEWDWTRLCTVVRPFLMSRLCTRLGLRAEDAEDVVQDVFEGVLRRAPRVRYPERYLLAATYNAGIERLRKDGRLRFTAEMDEGVAVDARFAERLVARCAARSAFERIDPGSKRLIQRYCIEGRSLKEISLETGVTVNAVWKRIQQCLRSMNLRFQRADRGIRRRLEASHAGPGAR